MPEEDLHLSDLARSQAHIPPFGLELSSPLDFMFA